MLDFSIFFAIEAFYRLGAGSTGWFWLGVGGFRVGDVALECCTFKAVDGCGDGVEDLCSLIGFEFEYGGKGSFGEGGWE